MKMRICKDEKMRRCEDEKMWRWEDVKMSEDVYNRPPLLEEPFAQTPSGKTATAKPLSLKVQPRVRKRIGAAACSKAFGDAATRLASGIASGGC